MSLRADCATCNVRWITGITLSATGQFTVQCAGVPDLGGGRLSTPELTYAREDIAAAPVGVRKFRHVGDCCKCERPALTFGDRLPLDPDGDAPGGRPATVFDTVPCPSEDCRPDDGETHDDTTYSLYVVDGFDEIHDDHQLLTPDSLGDTLGFVLRATARIILNSGNCYGGCCDAGGDQGAFVVEDFIDRDSLIGTHTYTHTFDPHVLDPAGGYVGPGDITITVTITGDGDFPEPLP